MGDLCVASVGAAEVLVVDRAQLDLDGERGRLHRRRREQGCHAGVVINPGTPVEAVEPVADIIDLCLVMSVNPGWGGQRYIPSSTGRLARLREMLPAEVVLEVDGGISLDTIDGARDAGTDVFVAGSSVFGAPDPAEAFRALQARVG